jgi:Derlin-2/3
MTSALILAFTYTACQDDRLSKVTFFVVTIPATWVPLAMLFLTFVINGSGAAKIQATGLVAAHAHDFLSNIYPTFGGGANIVQTPEFIKRFFAITVQRVVHRAYGTAITNPRQPRASAASTGTSSATAGSVLPESWKSRGTGHRLGGD